MIAQAPEERPHGLNVSRPVGVEGDHIFELGRHLFQALTTSLITLTSHPDEALLPWGMMSHS